MADKGSAQSYTGDQPRMSERAIKSFSERTPTVTYRQERLGTNKPDRTQRSFRSYSRG